MTQKPDNPPAMMTNEQLAAEVARVKELHKAVGYDSPDFSPCAEIRFFQYAEKMAAIIANQDAIIQHQREVMRMARDAFRAIETTGLNNVCSGLDSKHVRDHNITVAQNALARINSVIGDKK